jgi:hypothetical protein
MDVACCKRLATLLLSLVFSGVLQAQEIKFIDLSNIQQRTALRYPPAPQPNCTTQGCVGAGSGGVSVGDCASDPRSPRALGVALDSVVPTDITLDPFEAEFRVVNTGFVPIELPVSPHLSDLQPADERQSFPYLSLELYVFLFATGPMQASGLGHVELYGSREHKGTIVTLKPGEWIRVKAKLKLHTWPSQAVEARLQGNFWIHKNVYKPHKGGTFTEVINDCPNHTLLPSTVTVRFLPTRSTGSKAQKP